VGDKIVSPRSIGTVSGLASKANSPVQPLASP
jgi:hypothetical protein